ncbi:MAG: chromosomal replication initiator protein DnaA [Deltaproteobacteria bacterium]|nr:chromosomal replication initiator protein DnaA [Deltaproteobacteria bacterium]
MDSENIWKSCLDTIVEFVSPQHFSTWFRPIKLIGGSSDELELEVPNRFFLEWIKEHYLPLILDVLRKEAKKDISLVWRVCDEMPEAVAAPAKKSSSKESGTAKAQKPVGLNLSHKYTFDNFVIGKANEFAYAACSAAANSIGSKYNPLFIYGCVGLGKTHLLQAIGHKVLTANPSAKVCYYTSERFMNDFINFVSRQKMSEFRSRFRNVDVLLIDDIQFWAGKERTQEEFFHTFNTLYEAHKQIVVTSDKFPKDIDGLEERLRSRFEWGLVADIQPPDTETKIAILRKKAKGEGVKLPDDVANWLASVSNSNVRELEGFLNRIIAVSSLTNQEITLSMSREALKNLLKEKEEKIITIDEIQKAVSAFYNIKFSDLKSKRRHKTIALPRQAAMYLAREYGKFSFPEIGSAFGGKDHSTAIHACKKIEKDIKENPELKHAVKSIKQNLGIN